MGKLLTGGRARSQARENGFTTGNSFGEIESAGGVGVLWSFLGRGSDTPISATACQADISAGDAMAIVVVVILVAVLFGVIFIVAAGSGVHVAVGMTARHRGVIFRVVEVSHVLWPVGV